MYNVNLISTFNILMHEFNEKNSYRINDKWYDEF